MAASILPNRTVLAAGPIAATQAAQPHVMPAAGGGFTELLAELQAVPAKSETATPPTAKLAKGTNDTSETAVQPNQTSVPGYLDPAPVAGAVAAHTQTVPATAATTETSAKKPVTRTAADAPSPSQRPVDEPTIATPTLPASAASAQTVSRAAPQPAAAQPVIIKDEMASIEQQPPAAAPAAARDDRKVRTETAAQDTATQSQAQPPLPPQPIVTTMAPASPPAGTAEASSNAPRVQVEAVGGRRTSASDNTDQRQQAEPIAVTSDATPAVVVSPHQVPQPVIPAPARPEPPALQQAIGKAAETVAARVGRAVQDGTRVLTMQLHPAELGRVEVRLSFHDSGIGVQMTVDRPETYDAFTRNRGAMEQHLANNGINLTTGGLDLRFGQQPDRSVPQPSMHAVRVPLSGDTASSESPPPARSMRDGLIDILA